MGLTTEAKQQHADLSAKGDATSAHTPVDPMQKVEQHQPSAVQQDPAGAFRRGTAVGGVDGKEEEGREGVQCQEGGDTGGIRRAAQTRHQLAEQHGGGHAALPVQQPVGERRAGLVHP